jgi:hypothetical protein
MVERSETNQEELKHEDHQDSVDLCARRLGGLRVNSSIRIYPQITQINADYEFLRCAASVAEGGSIQI